MAREPPPAEFALLEGYWEALREGVAIPPRAAIEPRAIARILDRALLLERLAPGVARIRLGGLALVDLMGMDLRGMPLTALVAPVSRGAVAAAVERVFAGPAAAELALEGERGIGRPALAARLLLLPLSGRTGAVDRAIGVMVIEGRPGRTPRRFVLARAAQRPVGALRLAAPPPEPPPEPPAAPAPGFAEPQPGWRPMPPAAPRLRLVWSVDGGAAGPGRGDGG
jgi:hypothetical protein